jgi:hypothetical protein
VKRERRDLLDVLEAELSFIEKGGYGRSVRTPWLPTSIFQDSPVCLNFGDLDRSRPCSECPLMALVPPERRSEDVPCHHIPLTAEGETIHYLERNDTQDVMEEKVKEWLVRMISLIRATEAERARSATASAAGSCPP